MLVIIIFMIDPHLLVGQRPIFPYSSFSTGLFTELDKEVERGPRPNEPAGSASSGLPLLPAPNKGTKALLRSQVPVMPWPSGEGKESGTHSLTSEGQHKGLQHRELQDKCLGNL